MVKVFTQLSQEETEGIAIGLTNIDCIEQLTSTAQSCYCIHIVYPVACGHLIQLLSVYPSTLPLVSVPEHRLINIDYAQAIMQCLNKLRCSKLSLELGSKTILQTTNGLDPSVCGIQFTPEVIANKWFAHSKLALLSESLLECTQ